jgi:Ca2+-transporting ATPase
VEDLMGAVAAREPSPEARAPDRAGLSSHEAAQRLRQDGPNALVLHERLEALKAFLHTLADPMALMLGAAGAVYFLLGEVRDGVVLLVSLVPVLAADVALDLRSRAALRKLAAAASPRAHVRRDGREIVVPSEDVVAGDLLILREGDVVQADGDVCVAANLSLDESQLTGESEPVAKAPGDPVFAGSLIVAGQGEALVARTGARTRYGDIARMVAESEPPATPLQRKTGRLVRRLGIGALVLAGAMALFTYLHGGGAGRALLAGISLAMAALPEEFPLVLTVFLSLGAWRLSRAGVLVRRLASVEALGSTTVICTDKTGTLTQGMFGLAEVLSFDSSDEKELLAVAALACEIDPQEPMDRAILHRARTAGLPETALQQGTLVIDYAFDPKEKLMAHVWRDARGAERIAAKGAFEGILARCSIGASGDAAGEAGARAAAQGAHDRMAAAGRRVLAVATRAGAFSGERERDLRDLRLVGLLGFSDPIRPEVPAAVAECAAAGVRVKVVTGDSPVTAHAIAEAAGIAHEHGPGILTGEELASAGDEGILRASIYARVQPGQKHLIVEAHQRAGEIVAMTGDGINDAPALRQADVGVSMGVRGTPVARAAADLVLLHDDFGALVTAVREGRHIFDNLVDAFLFLVAFHVPVIALAVVVPLLGLPPLLMPIHLVWLELVVHPISAFVFEGGASPGAMHRPPRPPSAPILPRRELALSILSGALLAAAALWLYQGRLAAGEAGARSIALAAVILGGLVLTGVAPAVRRSRRFLAVGGTVAVSLPLAMYWRPVALALQLAPLDLAGWGLALLAALAATGWRFRPGAAAS